MTVRTPAGTEIVVVDSQVHMNLIGLEQGLGGMNAIGIDHVIYDEWWRDDHDAQRRPNYILDGHVEHLHPLSLEAAIRYPDRFSCTAWLDYRHRDLDSAMSRIATNPYQHSIRLPIRATAREQQALAAGEFDTLFAAAAKHQVPLMVCLPQVPLHDRFAAITPSIRRFPETVFILDHCAILPLSTDEPHLGTVSSIAETLKYAEFPNAMLKWSWAPLLSQRPYPYHDVLKGLREAIGAFGAHRIVWASDTTQTSWHHPWAQALHYILDAGSLDESEKSAILGANALRILRIVRASTVPS